MEELRENLKTLKLFGRYKGKELLPQTLSAIVWRHYLHPEDKSLAPDGERCGPYTRGLLRRRPIQAIIPFVYIGKEIERKAQEGEDISVAENAGPMKYQSGQTLNTRAADPALIQRGKRFGVRQLIRASGAHQRAVERFLRGARVHPSTRTRLAKAIEKLEKEARKQAY